MAEELSEQLPSFQLIDGEGSFNQLGIDSLVKHIKLGECGLSYAVVSIMGPQSSGKSTLLNHLFYTRFREMDALRARSQTTQGVWLAKARGLNPCTLIMDLEGTDGRERGEDDTTFEKQSALFALAVSDIVLINMWCHDIGREHAANKPLLKTVFQVMMRLFSPRRTTLLFVIRDKTKTPLEILEPILREDIKKMWVSVPKPPKYESTPLEDFFNVEVTALASYEEKEEQFKEQVAQLRSRFEDSIAPGGLAGDRRTVVPGAGFALSAQEIWKVIKENKDLDLPAHKVMVATVRCEEIAQQKLSELLSHEEWQDLQESAKVGPVIGFGKRLRTLFDKIFSGYDTEAAYFDGNVRDKKRSLLVSRSFEITQPAYQAIVGHNRANTLEKFKKELDSASVTQDEGFASFVRKCTKTCLDDFDKACADAHIPQTGWDSAKAREKLQRDMEAYAVSVQEQRLIELEKTLKKCLEEALAHPAASLLDAASSNTWPGLRKLLNRETEISKKNLSVAIAGFELNENDAQKMLSDLFHFGQTIIKKIAREEANKALMRMKERFMSVFSYDAESMPRVWSKEDDIRAITRDSRLSAVKLLSILAAIRLEEKSDMVEASLLTLVGDSQEIVQGSAGTVTTTESRSSITSASDTLASSTWEGIAGEDTLLTPVQCRSLWRQFQSETQYTITQALAAQEASKNAHSWLPPPWAIVAMVVLGFNEFMTLLRNPIYLAIGFILYLLGRAVWVQLDIGREFQHGWLPGLLSVSSKLIPTLMNILKKLVEEGQRLAANEDSYAANHQRYNKEVQMGEFDSQASSNESSSANGHNEASRNYLRQRQGSNVVLS